VCMEFVTWSDSFYVSVATLLHFIGLQFEGFVPLSTFLSEIVV